MSDDSPMMHTKYLDEFKARNFQRINNPYKPMYTCTKCGNRLLDGEQEYCKDCKNDEWEEGYEDPTTII